MKLRQALPRFLALWMFVCCLGVASQAADKPAKTKKPANQSAKQTKKQTGQLLNLPPAIELTDEQKNQLKDLQEKHAETAKELQAKLNSAQTPEYKKARAELMKAAKEAGKTQKEIQQDLKALDESLSADAKEALMAARKDVREFKQKFLAEASEFLTDEQKAHLPGMKQGGKKKAE